MTAEVRFDEILRVLAHYEVDFIVVGGVAAILQGSPLTTEDVDVVFAGDDENISRLSWRSKSSRPFMSTRQVGASNRTFNRLVSGNVHLFKTNRGRLDALRTVDDQLGFDNLVEKSRLFELDDFAFRVLDLKAINETKEQANRPKDQYQLPFLRQLLEEIRKVEDG